MSTTAEMKIGAIAPWFGGKRTLAPTIVEELGKHSVYWEPFCGSMAVLFAKPQSRMETVNDLHGDLINLARTIQHPTHGPRFYRQLRRTWFSEGAYRDADAFLTGDVGEEIDPARAHHYFVKSWMGRNGMSGLDKDSGCSNLCVRYSPSGGDPGVRFRNLVETIPAFRCRLRGVTILRRDAFEVIGKIHDEANTCVYLDPPYLTKGCRYLHDFSDGFMGVANDHERLAESLARFKKARIVVSYYEHPALRQLYPGWTCRAVHTNKHTANAREGATATVAPELLLINGPSYAKGAA